MAVTGMRLERLLDVNVQEALPHRDVSTEAPHLPGTTGVTQYDSAAKEEIAHLRHLYDVRVRPELFDDFHVDLTIEAWHKIALDNGRLLYDCHTCHVTWPIRDSAATCLVGHPIP